MVRLVSVVQSGENHYHDRSGVLSGIGEVREFLASVTVAAETLGKTEVGRQTSNDWSDEPSLVNALVIVCCCRPVAFICCVEADHVLKIEEDRN